MGNRAWIGGVVTKSDNPTRPEGSRAIWVVEDNGEGANDPPDRMSLVFTGAGGPFFDCNTSTLAPSEDVENGNLQVASGA